MKFKIIFTLFLSIPFIYLASLSAHKSTGIEIGIEDNNSAIRINKGDTVRVVLSGRKYLSGYQWMPCPVIMPKFLMSGPRFIGDIKKSEITPMSFLRADSSTKRNAV